MTDPAALLQVRELSVQLRDVAASPLLDQLELTVFEGESVAVLGRNGAGKTTLLHALLRLLDDRDFRIESGVLRLAGRESRLAVPIDRSFYSDVGFVPQEPDSALLPYAPVGRPLVKALRRTASGAPRPRLRDAIHWLEQLGVAQAATVVRQYPHELSSGTKYQVLLAQALARAPRCLILDSPLALLSPESARCAIELLEKLRRKQGLTLLLTSCDALLAKDLDARCLVLDEGRLEPGELTFDATFDLPRPRPLESFVTAPVLQLESLTVLHRKRAALPWKRRFEPVLRDVRFHVAKGESITVVGDTASGKSVLTRLIARTESATYGRILVDGRDIADASERALRRVRRTLQVVFPNARECFDPALSCRDALKEGLRIHRLVTESEANSRIDALAAQLQLPKELLERSPRTLSTAHCQLLNLARGLLIQPRLLVCDDNLSALDLDRQVCALEVLARHRDDHGVALLLMTHDRTPQELLTQHTVELLDGKLVEPEAAVPLTLPPGLLPSSEPQRKAVLPKPIRSED